MYLNTRSFAGQCCNLPSSVKEHLQGHYTEIGKNLFKFRKAKGYSQQELSNRCNVERSQISKLERGQIECYHTTLVELADALEIDIHDLIPPSLNRTISKN